MPPFMLRLFTAKMKTYIFALLTMVFIALLSIDEIYGEFCKNIPFVRIERNHTIEDMVTTRLNRCLFYPRCLLFDCCDPVLLRNVNAHVGSQLCMSNAVYRCMYDDSCAYNASISRAWDIVTFPNPVTHKVVTDGIWFLPPTPPSVYEKLAERSEFRILYLVQGDVRRRMDQVLTQTKHDMFYLSFLQRRDADIFFPGSTYGYGRLALYLTARLLEIKQGWLYDFYVFVDDDVDWGGHVTSFENKLREWQPAMASPNYVKNAHSAPISYSVEESDQLFVAYHRETVEILYPWILDYDTNCFAASSYIHRLESAAVYRNHYALFNDRNVIKVQNRKIRNLPRDCGSEYGNGTVEPLATARKDHMAALPPTLQHCVPPYESYKINEWVGILRHKGNANYHLMDGLAVYFTAYARFNQSKTCPVLHSFNRHFADCCTVDVMQSSAKYDVNDSTVLPNKAFFDLIPINGTIFDIPNLEEVVGCGTKWQHRYTRFHKKLISLIKPGYSIRQLVSVATTHGLADQLQGIVTELYLAILTGRALRLTTYERAPDITAVFDSPHVNWTASSDEFPSIVFNPMKFRGKGRVLPIVYCQGRGKFGKKVDPNEYGQICLTNDEELAEKIFVNQSMTSLQHPWALATVLFVASNRGRSYAMFKENVHDRHALNQFDIKHPEACFLCGFLYLFRPNAAVVDVSRSLWQRLTADKHSIVIGVKIRIGDHVFDASHQNSGLEVGLELIDRRNVKNHFDCAEELDHSLRRNEATAGWRIKWLLITDSRPLRLAAREIYGDKLIVDTDMKPLHSDCAINKIGKCDQATMNKALQLAASDILSFSHADYHIFTEQSGFGRAGAWLSPAQAIHPHRHVFNLQKNTPRSCAYQDADDFLFDARLWAGI